MMRDREQYDIDWSRLTPAEAEIVRVFADALQQAQRAAGAARTRRRGDRIGHHNRAQGVLVARAISSPTFSLKVGVSNGAISLQYIHSRTDLSVLITFSGKRFFSVSF